MDEMNDGDYSGGKGLAFICLVVVISAIVFTVAVGYVSYELIEWTFG